MPAFPTALFSQLSALFINCPFIANPAPAMNTSSCQVLEFASQKEPPQTLSVPFNLFPTQEMEYLHKNSEGGHTRMEKARLSIES